MTIWQAGTIISLRIMMRRNNEHGIERITLWEAPSIQSDWVDRFWLKGGRIMKYIGRIFAAILAFVMWSSSAQADRLSDAYDHLLNASFELPSIAAGALLDDIGLIVNGVLEEKKLSGENVDLEKSILGRLEEEKTLVDVAELTAELQRATTLGELQEVLIQFFGTKAGERLLELLIESEYLTAVDGVYRLADWAMAAYEGLDAVSVNSSNMILEEAEIINDNLNEIYARIESVAKNDIASNGFTEPKGREAQLKYITDRYYADARQVYEKIENELRQNWWNLFRNPKEKVALERMRDAFKAYLEENPSYYDYYAAYVRNLKRNPKNLEIQEMTGRYEEADSMLYVQVHAVSEIQWISYRFEIRLQDTLVYEETRINDGQLSYRYDQPGQYTINVTAEDRWGQKKQRRLMMDVPGSQAGNPSDEETVPDEAGGGVQPSPVDTPVDPLRDTASGGNTKGQEWETVEMICGNVSAYCIGGMWGILLKDGMIASEPIYTCVGLCNCGQGARDYGFEETIFAIRENQWYILSPKTGLEAGSHGAHGGATGLPMWNADSGMYSNAYGGHQYDGGMSAAYDENSLRGGSCTFSLMNCDGKAIISGASMISVPATGRSTIHTYCKDTSRCAVVVKNGEAYMINQNGDMLRVGTDAKWFYDDIVPIRADDGWTYYSAYGERLTATGYEDATSVWRDSEHYYGWVRENGSWHMFSLSDPGG